MGIFSAFSGLASDISSGFGNLFDSSPAVNIDGTPMVGDVDINGNAFGITENDVGADHDFSSSSPSFDDGFLSTAIDTESSSTMSDSFSSGCGSDDSFGSDSMFDNVFEQLGRLERRLSIFRLASMARRD